MNSVFDLVVIGSGPGGYTGAIRAAQLGLKVALVEKESSLGGTCLNVGCIPSKALLDSSELYHMAQKEFSHHGIDISKINLRLKDMMKRKENIVKELTNGISFLMKKNKIALFQGHGKLKSSEEIEVISKKGEIQNLKAKNIMLATGSRPHELPFLKFDEQKVLSSTGALSLSEVPEKMVIIGAGVVGVELGSVWNRLGTKVTLLEASPYICGSMDHRMTQKLKTLLENQGLHFLTQVQVTHAQVEKEKVILNYKDSKRKEETLSTPIVLVATGRKPYSENLGLEDLALEKNSKGQVLVDSSFRTQNPHIYAIGDLIPGPMLAHKAEEEGVAVAELVAGKPGHVNYKTLPSVVYTWPELASVGQTEEELKEKNIAYNIGRFPFSANGRAKAMASTEGLVKILAHKQTDEILGVHILGPRASDLLGEAIVAMEFKGSSEDLARSFHAHPTLTETLREAALAVDKRARQM